LSSALAHGINANLLRRWMTQYDYAGDRDASDPLLHGHGDAGHLMVV